MNGIASRILRAEMPKLSTTRIVSTFTRSDAASTNSERGRLLEELTAYIFARCEGVRYFQNNLLNVAGSSEIDVCFWNNRIRGSLDFLPKTLVVECKNTNERVGSPAVHIFASKLRIMRLNRGILIAANGVTGNPQELNAAHDVIRTTFLTSKIRILVLTRAELEKLTNTDGLIELLQNKFLLLTVQVPTF